MQGKFSLRASITSELFFEDCFVPEENILPGVRGMRGPLSCLTQARYGISWGAIGAAIACYECARDYARERKVFGNDDRWRTFDLRGTDLLARLGRR